MTENPTPTPFKSEHDVPFTKDTFFFASGHTQDLSTDVFNGHLPKKYAVPILNHSGKEEIASKLTLSELLAQTDSDKKIETLLKLFIVELRQINLNDYLDLAEMNIGSNNKEKVQRYYNTINHFLTKNPLQIRTLTDYLQQAGYAISQYAKNNEVIQERLRTLQLILDNMTELLKNPEVLQRAETIKQWLGEH